MRQYLELLREIKARGTRRGDRTGTGTIDLFGHQMRFDLSEGFPLITTKKMFLKAIIHELLWILSGDTNIKYLNDNGVTIWDEWADEDGNLGPVYGAQWRDWRTIGELPAGPDMPRAIGSVDQIDELIRRIRKDPESRRHVVSAWNVGDLPSMRLAPCHCLFQFHVADGKLSCQLYQRSADVFLGVPFNIASYALLTMMVAHVCDLEPGEFIHTFGSVHIYLNHQEQVDLQLSREPRPLPKMMLNPKVRDIFGFTYQDFKLDGYDPHPTIKADVAV